MIAHRVTPILNVSDIMESFRWFEKLGWKKGWDWGDPPTFGGICSGECEIFLCQGAQGGRGNGGVKMTFGPDGNDAADKGRMVTSFESARGSIDVGRGRWSAALMLAVGLEPTLCRF